MAETNATQKVTTPQEAVFKDRRVEEIDSIARKFRFFRWICFIVFGFALIAAFDIVSSISGGLYTLDVSVSSIWMMLILSPIAWYVSHCLKFVRAWENMVVFRLGEPHKKAERKAGPRWVWYFVDKNVFVRIDQQQILLPELSILSEDNIELKIRAFFIFRITKPLYFLINVAEGVKTLTDIVEAEIRGAVGSNTFEIVREERGKIAEEIIESVNAKIAESKKEWGMELLQVRLKDIDAPPDVVEKIQNILKALKDQEVVIINADAKRAETERIAEAEKFKTMRAAEAEKFEIEARGEANAKAITLAAEALKKEGADNFVAMEIAKAIKTGDKIIIQNLTDLLSLVRPLFKGAQGSQKQ